MTPTLSEKYTYLDGFGNHFSSEAIAGSLPIGQNTPQRCAYGLVAEQLSGTAFTLPRATNRRTWLYRATPSVKHSPLVPYDQNEFIVSDFSGPDLTIDLSQRCWNPFDLPGVTSGGYTEKNNLTFVDGIRTIAGAGGPACRSGLAVHIYIGDKDMEHSAFCNADGDLMIVPQHGALDIQTEFGWMLVRPNEIAVIQRGMRFRVRFPQGPSRGYMLETFGAHFELPDLGPIGANGLANPRDFQTPVASFDGPDKDKDKTWTLIQKFNGKLFQCTQDHTPFDVAGWHGNYVPYKYDLARFAVVNSVTFDHMDPSIFTVLTVKSNTPGQAVVDFVIFPPRWAVTENTFRPPYFHRNDMSEFMGLILGSYEGKEKNLKPGGATLHSAMTPHGPDAEMFAKGSTDELKAMRVGDGTQSFMWETSYMMSITKWAAETCGKVQPDYYKVWSTIETHFQPPQ